MSEQLISLSDSDLRALADAIRANRLAPPFSAVSLQRLLPPATCPPLAEELQRFVQLGFGAQHLVATIQLMLEDRSKRLTADEVIDLVTTGPEARGVTTRDTVVVVREMFANSQDAVLVAGYAVYQGQRVFQALADRMHERPHLEVQMILDIQRGPGDTSAASEIVRRFTDRFRSLQWPPDRRLPELFYDPRSLETESSKRACMHAKCIVVDTRDMFVSSANFTEAAQERNIEVGLLIHSCSLAERIERHFATLVSEGLLKPAQ